jgi:hypothetical protein
MTNSDVNTETSDPNQREKHTKTKFAWPVAHCVAWFLRSNGIKWRLWWQITATIPSSRTSTTTPSTALKRTSSAWPSKSNTNLSWRTRHGPDDIRSPCEKTTDQDRLLPSNWHQMETPSPSRCQGLQPKTRHWL